MQRLVYAPKAYVYTKAADGTVYNLTDYITAGQVDRKLNQVSTAQVTLRNPQRVFTRPSQGVAFHPQDPITIYLQRLQGYPVRVFTGYLNKTPYYQLYPGTITLQASCTLKRLLYSFFDPSLPYLIAFFEKYGWINTGKGSLISSQSFGAKQMTTQADVNAGKKPFTQLQDGSLGKLLWATLYDIGDWKDSEIYIEDLPTGPNGIAARMATLMQSIQQSQQNASDEFTTFLESVVGTSSQGSGGGNSSAPLTGNSNAEKIWNYLVPVFGEIGAAGALGNMAQETGGGTLAGINTADSGTGASGMGGMGIVQWTAGRRINEIAFANSHNLSPTDLQAQLGFLVHEVHSTPSYQPLIQAMRNATSPSDAALKWNQIYEGGTDPNGIRETVAASAYAQFHNSTAQQNSSRALGQGKVQQFLGASTSSPSSSGSPTTRIQAVIEAANVITNKHYPYIWGGGHGSLGTPSVGVPGKGYDGHSVGFDCSGAVSAVLSAANILTPGSSIGSDQDVISTLQQKGLITPGIGRGNPSLTIWDSPGVHIYMTINGKYFGTWAPGANSPGGGGWLTGSTNAGYTPYKFTQRILNESTTYSLGLGSGSTSTGGGATSSRTSAQAFTAELQFPSIEDQVTAIALGSEGKGFMHDQSLMPFVQQLADASLRSFQSLPNGDFYAFYPDYFGEMGTSPPYWLIDDIEILDGGIDLSDDGLATHVYAVGDNSWPVNNELVNELFSAGSITVYNAFLGDLVDTNSTGKGTGTNKAKKGSAATTEDPGANLSGNIMNADEAVKFVERYGARPLVKQYPMIRSAIYEMLVAYQQFMTAWSTQFQTPYSFTFMPEVFPGGKVAFPNHGLQMYVNEVVHQWDYAEAGFTTTATLSAPAIYGNANPDLPPDMVRAMVEPVSTRKPTATTPKNINAVTGQPPSTNRRVTQVIGKVSPKTKPSSGALF